MRVPISALEHLPAARAVRPTRGPSRSHAHACRHCESSVSGAAASGHAGVRDEDVDSAHRPRGRPESALSRCPRGPHLARREALPPRRRRCGRPRVRSTTNQRRGPPGRTGARVRADPARRAGDEPRPFRQLHPGNVRECPAGARRRGAGTAGAGLPTITSRCRTPTTCSRCRPRAPAS